MDQNTVYMTVQEKIVRDIVRKSTPEMAKILAEMTLSHLIGISFRMAYKNRWEGSEFYSDF